MDELPERLARLGLCALTIDIRGVGWRGSNFQPEGEGLLTHGLESPTRHAYRGGLMDCLRGLEALRSFGVVDGSSIAVMGEARAAASPSPVPRSMGG